MKHLFLKLALLASVLASVSGCSILTNSIARSASDIATQNMMRVVKEVDGDKTVHLTVAGASALNLARDGTSRPLAYCVYLVRSAEWAPSGVDSEAGACVTRERDAQIIQSERLIVAPNQMQQSQYKLMNSSDLWLVLTGDYGYAPNGSTVFRQSISGRGWIHTSVWATAQGFYTGGAPLPPESFAGHVASRPLAVNPVVNTTEQAVPSKTSRSKSNSKSKSKVNGRSVAVEGRNVPLDSSPLRLNLTTIKPK
jgi:predicted component of type VI protein secretion system